MASFIVIICHCNFFAVFAPESESLHRFTTCLVSDSVGMFWLITGFYFLQGSNYKKLLFGTLKKVVIPGLLMVFITRFLTDPIINGIPFSESTAFTSEELSAFFIRLVTFRETSVYWYVFAYILVTVIQPLLKKLGDWLDKGSIRQIFFMIVTLGLLIANDLMNNGLLHFSYSGIFVLIPASIEVMWGHILFKNRKLILKLPVIIASLVAAVVLVTGRTIAYTYCLENELGSHLISWYTSFGFVMAAIAVFVCMAIVNEDAEHPYDDAIRYPAGYTYPIYLIHPFLLSFARVRGFFKVTNEWLVAIFPAGAASVIAVLLGFAFFYLISFGIAIILRKFCKLIHY